MWPRFINISGEQTLESGCYIFSIQHLWLRFGEEGVFLLNRAERLGNLIFCNRAASLIFLNGMIFSCLPLASAKLLKPITGPIYLTVNVFTFISLGYDFCPVHCLESSLQLCIEIMPYRLPSMLTSFHAHPLCLARVFLVILLYTWYLHVA